MNSLPFLADDRVRVSCDLRRAHLARLDALKDEWGLSSRAEVLHRLLDQVFLDG